MIRFFLGIFIVLSTTLGIAAIKPLKPDNAFVLSVNLQKNNQLKLEWKIAPSYFIYRSSIAIDVQPPGLINKIQMPEGQVKKDVLHGVFQAYNNKLIVLVDLKKAAPVLQLDVNYQGCSTEGFCYAPIHKNFAIKNNLNQIQVIQSSKINIKSEVSQGLLPEVNEFFNQSSVLLTLLSFLGLGLLLAFTPCVLPMVPILSGIIVGHSKKSSTAKPFLLSLAYVFGMAITYAVVGMIIALIGSGIQAKLQKPWLIILFSGIFLLLACSLFGFYELQLPVRWRNFITHLSNRQKGGKYFGVMVMGSLSTLIVAPCVSAPLVGVLAYIGQTGDVWLGGGALLFLGIGMGIPLLVIGLSAGRFLPKAGLWMTRVERFFGILMLGMTIWMLSRMIPGPITLFLWGLLFVFAAIYFTVFAQSGSHWKWLTRSIGMLLFVYGLILIIGAVFKNTDILNPWEQMSFNTKLKTDFIKVQTLTEINHQIEASVANQQPVLLDFYADWCVSCVIMDNKIFNKPSIKIALQNYKLLRVDVTQNTDSDQEILNRYSVVGPPTIIFLNRKGEEIKGQRIIGEVSANEFLTKLKSIGN